MRGGRGRAREKAQTKIEGPNQEPKRLAYPKWLLPRDQVGEGKLKPRPWKGKDWGRGTGLELLGGATGVE